MNEPRLDPNL